MLITNSVISSVGMILLPLIAGFFLAKKFKLSFKDFRKLFTAGALTFIVSQVLHIPLVYGLTILFKNHVIPSPPESITPAFNAILLGLLAGAFEETARYILFKYFLKTARTWKDGLIVGLGHGGIESILVGILAISTLANMIAFRDVNDLSKFGVPADQAELVKTQVAEYWSQPVAAPFFGFMERVSAISLHLALSVMVLYSIVSENRKWFWFALLWHAFVDAISAYLYPIADKSSNILLAIFWLELLIAILGVGLLMYAIRLRSKFPEEQAAQVK